jgi:hypothetical protein
MDISELRKLPMPKLRERAKQHTDLQGVLGMKKEELVVAIAKAEGISYEPLSKDVATISSLKQEIRSLKKRKAELLASAKDRRKIKQTRRKIKLLKRETRKLSREARAKGESAVAAAESAAPAASAG